MKKMTYTEQLQHPNWQRKRLEVMEAAEFSCELCGDKENMLNVHHKRYVKGRMAWEYESSELQCLCRDCHTKSHKNKDFLDGVVSQFPPESVPILTELLIGFGDEYVDPAMWIDLEATRVARIGSIAWYLTNLSDAEALEVHQFCMAHAPDCFLSAIRSYSEG